MLLAVAPDALAEIPAAPSALELRLTVTSRSIAAMDRSPALDSYRL